MLPLFTDLVAGVVVARTFAARPFLIVTAHGLRSHRPAFDDLAASLWHRVSVTAEVRDRARVEVKGMTLSVTTSPSDLKRPAWHWILL